MELTRTQRQELNRDGDVDILTVNGSQFGTHVIFSRLNHGGQLPDRLLVRSAFFNADGDCIYNMIISNEKIKS